MAAGALARAVATTLRCGQCDASPHAFAEMLVRAERAERAAQALSAGDAREGWDGSGRLIGEWPDGDLAQVTEAPGAQRRVLEF